MSKAKYTSIGGQALIEGIMMKGPEKTAMAVRRPDKEIEIKYLSSVPLSKKYNKVANKNKASAVENTSIKMAFTQNI